MIYCLFVCFIGGRCFTGVCCMCVLSVVGEGVTVSAVLITVEGFVGVPGRLFVLSLQCVCPVPRVRCHC